MNGRGKKEIRLQAAVESTGGTLLLELAMAIREYRLRPESLVWTHDRGSAHVTINIVVPIDRVEGCQTLCERLRSIPGVERVLSRNCTEEDSLAARGQFTD